MTGKLKKITLDKRGIEIGGPSGQSDNIYRYCNSMDNVTFSKNTIWHTQTDDIYRHKSRTLGKYIICDAVDLRNHIEDDEYDFLFASHTLEHIANPIKALKEWIRIVKDGGSIILILPEKSQMFDHKRSVTKLSDIIKRYKENVKEDDLSSLPEILALHDLNRDSDAGNYLNFVKRSQKNYENRCLHHCVYDVNLLSEISQYLGLEGHSPAIHGIDLWFIMEVKK
jgi:SAM-dependent methyltransferase